jgi:hypothetical protein
VKKEMTMYMIANITFRSRAEAEAAVTDLDAAGYAAFISDIHVDVYSDAVFVAAIRKFDDDEVTAKEIVETEVSLIVNPSGFVSEWGALRPGHDPFEECTLSQSGQIRHTLLSMLHKDPKQLRELCRHLDIDPDTLAAALRRD